LAPPVGGVLGGMTQGGTIPRFVPVGGDPDPLRALREEIAERLSSNWRVVRLRLLPIGVEHGRLMGIGLTCVRLYNVLNMRRDRHSSRVSSPGIKCVRLTGSTTTTSTRMS